MPLLKIAVRVETDRGLADAARQQRLLPRPNHADRNVGIRPQQVFVAIAQRQFQDSSGLVSRKRARIGGSTSDTDRAVIGVGAARGGGGPSDVSSPDQAER